MVNDDRVSYDVDVDNHLFLYPVNLYPVNLYPVNLFPVNFYPVILYPYPVTLYSENFPNFLSVTTKNVEESISGTLIAISNEDEHWNES